MSLNTIRQELLGLPGTNFGLVTTKINEAFLTIQDENVWSFQLQEGGWLTPGLLGGTNAGVSGGFPYLSPGSITVSPFSNTVTGDPVATAAWVAPSPFFLTVQQFRIPYYSLYNIIALGNNGTVSFATTITPGSGQTPGTYVLPVTDLTGPGAGATVSVTVASNGTVPAAPTVVSVGTGYQTPALVIAHGGVPATFTVTLAATLTLDRLWMEPAQTLANYMIYQAYFPAPGVFRRWYAIRDTTNNSPMNWWEKLQGDLAMEDPQRTEFDEPLWVVPYELDQRPGSATFGQMLFELWPHPIQQLPYTFACQANLPPLQAPGDTVPFPIPDEMVKLRTYEMLYLWKESQKGDNLERGSGANWQFLAQAARKEYDDKLKRIRLVDRNLVDLYFTKMERFGMGAAGEPYATVTGQLNVGGW